MKVFSYENNNGIATVGFTGEEKNFAVYADVHFIPGEAHEKLLQRAYINAKSAIDYEQEQDSHSLTTDEEGEPFTPDEPKLASIEIERIPTVYFDKDDESKEVEIEVTTLDQYGDDYEADVSYEATEGSLSGSILTIDKPIEFTEVSISASSEGFSDTIKFNVVPYTEPEQQTDLTKEFEEMKNVINAMLGVDGNEQTQ